MADVLQLIASISDRQQVSQGVQNAQTESIGNIDETIAPLLLVQPGSTDSTQFLNLDGTFRAIQTATVSAAGITTLIGENNMISNSAERVPTQQSVKAYVDSRINDLIGADAPPGALDTLYEIGNALATTLTPATAVISALAGKQPLDAELTELATMNSLTAAALADLTQTEVRILDGATVSTAEINHVVGVTSAIQTQLASKVETAADIKTLLAASKLDGAHVNVMGSANSYAAGLVLAGQSNGTRFLKEDGTWAAPGGGTTVSGTSLKSNNTGTNVNTTGGISLGSNTGNSGQGTYSIAIGFEAGKTNQGNYSLAIGYKTAEVSQGLNSLAIGSNACIQGQGTQSVAVGVYAKGGTNNGSNSGHGSTAVGYGAGYHNQDEGALAIGWDAGYTGQGGNTVAIGKNAGHTSQGSQSIAIGLNTAQTSQGLNSIAIGIDAGKNNQGIRAIAIGESAAMNSGQGQSSVAIGYQAGRDDQGEYAVAIGSACGMLSSQGTAATAVGNMAGHNNQGNLAVAIGNSAAHLNQGEGSVGIGSDAGTENQGTRSVAIGIDAGKYEQGTNSVAIGDMAGWGPDNTGQGNSAVAIGHDAGYSSQSDQAVAIGLNAGKSGQGNSATAIGYDAGATNQGTHALALGAAAGFTGQGQYAVAIGNSAGKIGQGNDAIAIGVNCALNSQGASAIAIGKNAGTTTSSANSIILNATGSELNSNGTSRFFVKPIRSLTNTNKLLYNSGTGEITYQADSGGGATSIVDSSVVSTNASSNVTGASTLVGAVILGSGAGTPLNNAIIIGRNAGTGGGTGTTGQVIIGEQAGGSYIGESMIAIGPYCVGGSASSGYGSSSVNIGDGAGYTNPGNQSVSIGKWAKYAGHTEGSVCIGNEAGMNGTANGRAVAIGYAAGKTGQGGSAVAIGYDAGNTSQSAGSVAVGEAAAFTGQGSLSVAIGNSAAKGGQGTRSVVVGGNAARSGGGDYGIAIGGEAGYTALHANSIILNASGSQLNSDGSSRFFVKPIRDSGSESTNITNLLYNTSTSEISHQTKLSKCLFAATASSDFNLQGSQEFSNWTVEYELANGSATTTAGSARNSVDAYTIPRDGVYQVCFSGYIRTAFDNSAWAAVQLRYVRSGTTYTISENQDNPGDNPSTDKLRPLTTLKHHQFLSGDKIRLYVAADNANLDASDGWGAGDGVKIEAIGFKFSVMSID